MNKTSEIYENTRDEYTYIVINQYVMININFYTLKFEINENIHQIKM